MIYCWWDCRRFRHVIGRSVECCWSLDGIVVDIVFDIIVYV